MSKEPEVVAFIFARGGSKGLPRKNVLPLAGKPLIAHAVDHALGVGRIGRVVVSTDDAEIAAAATAAGASAPFLRPPELAADDAPEWLAWRHALDWLEQHEGRVPDVFVSVPATAPLRQSVDIEQCLDRLAVGDCDMVITVTPAARSPWFNMVVLDDAGLARLVIPSERTVARRQAAPRCFDMTTVCYATTPAHIRRAAGVLDGRIAAVEVPRRRSIDIDDAYDMRIAEALWGME